MRDIEAPRAAGSVQVLVISVVAHPTTAVASASSTGAVVPTFQPNFVFMFCFSFSERREALVNL
jgi:hypothetical protein